MPAYRRVLLKLSGEALAGQRGFGIDDACIAQTARDVAEIVRIPVAVAVVLGGGNIFRGISGAARGMDRNLGDRIGMLATVLNGLTFQHALQREGVAARVMSAIRMEQICESYMPERAAEHLDCGRVVILVGGTGNPFFSTDSAAALRAAELHADAMLKATKVDGVYDRDPVKAGAAAQRFAQIGYDEVLRRDLKVMDATAIALCRDNRIPVVVFNMNGAGNMRRAVLGEPIGTLVRAGETLLG